MSQETNVDEAPDPTNIHWENLGIYGKKLFWNNIKANLLMTILVLGGFFGFLILRYFPNAISMKYPRTVHCGSMQDLYGLNNETRFGNMTLHDLEDTNEFKAFYAAAEIDKNRTQE